MQHKRAADAATADVRAYSAGVTEAFYAGEQELRIAVCRARGRLPAHRKN